MSTFGVSKYPIESSRLVTMVANLRKSSQVNPIFGKNQMDGKPRPISFSLKAIFILRIAKFYILCEAKITTQANITKSI